MKQKTALIAVGAGALALVAYYYTSLKKTVTNLNVSIFGAKYNSDRTQNSTFLKIWFDLKLKVENPTTRSLTINETLLDFYVNGKQVGEVRNFQKLTINPKVYSYLVIPTYLQTLSLFNLVSNFIASVQQKKPLKVTVKGTMDVEGNKIQVDEAFNLDLTPVSASLDYLKRLFGK